MHHAGLIHARFLAREKGKEWGRGGFSFYDGKDSATRVYCALYYGRQKRIATGCYCAAKLQLLAIAIRAGLTRNRRLTQLEVGMVKTG